MSMSTTAHSLQALVSTGVLREITPELESVAAQFSVSVTPAMLTLMNSADPHDPIAAQFIPSTQELVTHPHERTDPIGDKTHSPVFAVDNGEGWLVEDFHGHNHIYCE